MKLHDQWRRCYRHVRKIECRKVEYGCFGMFQSWQGIAFNQVPHSKNEIHGDRVARDYGFRGGLVPGVTVSAYLLHPAAEALGMPFLESGFAHVRVNSPLYDEEAFSVEVHSRDKNSYNAELITDDGRKTAQAEVSISSQPLRPPSRRGDPLGDKNAELMSATRENMQWLRDNGCRAFSYRWNAGHEMNTYLRDRDLMAGPYREGYANPSFILGISNWVLAANAYMNPWVHMETRSQHFAPIAAGEELVGEMSIKGLFEKKGHEFVDATVNIFALSDDSCRASVELRAIYRLRGT